MKSIEEQILEVRQNLNAVRGKIIRQEALVESRLARRKELEDKATSLGVSIDNVSTRIEELEVLLKEKLEAFQIAINALDQELNAN